MLPDIELTHCSLMWCWGFMKELCLCFCLCNLCPVLYNYMPVYSSQSWILAFNLSLSTPHWLYCPMRGPAEHLNWIAPPWPVSFWGLYRPARIHKSCCYFYFTLPVPNSPSLRQERGRQRQKLDEKSHHHALLHKTSVLPLTRDVLLCRSLQPMATTLYYIYCHHFSPPFSICFPALSVDIEGRMLERRTGVMGSRCIGEKRGWRFDTVRQD